jgi:hypothetical protein
MQMEQKEWYNNKELYEMFQQLKLDMADLSKEIAETRTLIRDYNGLRQKVDDTASKLSTLMRLMPVAITGVGLIFTILNYITRR